MQNIIEMQDVDSSQVAQIGHDAETNTLAIRFYRDYGRDQRIGPLYHYSNFTADDFAAFKAAESKGRHFGRYIKPLPEKYPYTRVEAKPSAPLADAA